MNNVIAYHRNLTLFMQLRAAVHLHLKRDAYLEMSLGLSSLSVLIHVDVVIFKRHFFCTNGILGALHTQAVMSSTGQTKKWRYNL